MDEPSLRKLFQGRDQLSDECAELADVLRRGCVSVEEQPYDLVPEPVPGLTRHHVWLMAHFHHGSQEHGDLKWWAWNWLRRQGESDPKFEYETSFGRPDVVAPAIRYVVECGDTPARKVIQSLEEGEWHAFILLPYAYVDDFDVEPPPRLYIFRPAEAWPASFEPRRKADLMRIKERRARIF